MTDILAEAVQAAESALRACLQPWLTYEVFGTTLDSQIHTAAVVAVRDAEQAWPHSPPKRDPASTTNAQLDRAPVTGGRRRYGREPFGFSRPEMTAPDHYLGGATLNEDYRDEKHRDATS